MFKEIKTDIAAILDRDPAARNAWEVFFMYPGFKAIMSHRIAHKLYNKGHKFIASKISNKVRRKYGIEIHPAAQIGTGVFIDHGMGVVIGETAVVETGCVIYQGVTLGGTGKEQGKRHPTIGDNVMISAGAKVLGSFTVGENSKIGAGSVVLKEVPPNSTVVGVPGIVVKRDNVRIPREDLDQVHLPNPVMMEIDRLQQENKELKERVDALSVAFGQK